MKQFILLMLVILTLSSAVLSASYHQLQQEAGWVVVFEEKFAPPSRMQFLKARKDWVDLWKVLHPRVPVFSWQNDDNSLFRIIPINRFASIDTLYRQMEQVADYSRARNREPEIKEPGHSSVSGFVMKWVPELSHNRGAEFDAYPQLPYTEWMFAFLISGHEQEAEQALERFRDYYIEKKLDYPWDTFRVLFGSDTPVIVGLFRAQSAAALHEKGRQIWAKHGHELEKLWEDVIRHTWKIENKTGWFNPSLSNVPAMSPDRQIVNSE